MNATYTITLNSISSIPYKSHTANALTSTPYKNWPDALETALELTINDYAQSANIIDNNTGEILFEIQHGRVIYAAEQLTTA